jgi:hypothetical protein
MCECADVRYLCAETRAAANRGRIESIRAAFRRLSSILCANLRLEGIVLLRATNRLHCAVALLQAE